MGDAWEWELADGAKIIAKLELPSRIESVWLMAAPVSLASVPASPPSDKRTPSDKSPPSDKRTRLVAR